MLYVLSFSIFFNFIFFFAFAFSIVSFLSPFLSLTQDLFFRWYSSAKSSHSMFRDEEDGSLLALVRVLYNSLPDDATGSGGFFDGVRTYCDRTQLFNHGIALVRACAKVCLEEEGGDGEDGEVDVEWTRDVEDKLSTLDLIRSYLHGVERKLITNHHVQLDYPVARLVALYLVSKLSAHTPPIKDASVTMRVLAPQKADPSEQEQKKPAPPEALLPFIDKDVQSVQHIVSSDFGFSGDAIRDRCGILALTAVELQRQLQYGTKGTLLLAAVNHVESIPPCELGGGVALYLWNNTLFPSINTLVHLIDRHRRSPSSSSSVTSSSSSPTSFLKVVSAEWSTDADYIRSVTSGAQRILVYIKRCVQEVLKQQQEHGGDHQRLSSVSSIHSQAGPSLFFASNDRSEYFFFFIFNFFLLFFFWFHVPPVSLYCLCLFFVSYPCFRFPSSPPSTSVLSRMKKVFTSVCKGDIKDVCLRLSNLAGVVTALMGYAVLDLNLDGSVPSITQMFPMYDHFGRCTLYFFSFFLLEFPLLLLFLLSVLLLYIGSYPFFFCLFPFLRHPRRRKAARGTGSAAEWEKKGLHH